MHYFGGCVLATDMVHWSACMTAFLAQPPDPAVVGDGWRDAWRERVEATEPWVHTWLAHQRRDDYWRQGSACERHAEIACPVFAIGGWSDGYRDMVLRMVEHSGGPVRGLIGPWGHTGPEAGAPGPAIGFLQEVVRFFDHALKGAENGFFDEPALIAYMQERIGPVTGCAERPGRWVADAAWPPPNLETRVLELGGEPRSLRGLQLTGPRGGRVVRRRRLGRRPGRPAARGRRVAVLGHRAAGRARRSCSGTWSPSWRWRPTAPRRSSSRGCATSRPTAAPR